MSSSVRAQLAAIIQPMIVGNRWSVKPHTVKQVTTVSRTTVYIEHTGIDPQPVAPVGMVDNTCVVTVVSALTDYAKAEDALDEKVMELVATLDGDPRLAWQNVRKVEIDDTYLGWAITLTLTTAKES